MLDPSGNGLMAVTTRFELPRFLTNRTPAWFKKILSPLKKSENGPVFRFFMDLNDAGTCCIDVTKHFLCFSALLDAL